MLPEISDENPWTIPPTATNGKTKPLVTAPCTVTSDRGTPTPIRQCGGGCVSHLGVTTYVNGCPLECTPVKVSCWPGAPCCSTSKIIPVLEYAWPLIARMLSPGCNPAAAAGDTATTLNTLPESVLTWVRPSPVTSSIATRKFAAGPPNRITIRCHAGLAWNPLGSSKSPDSMPPIR